MSALLLRFKVNYLLFSRDRPFKKRDNKVEVSLILPPPGLSRITNFILYTLFVRISLFRLKLNILIFWLKIFFGIFIDLVVRV